MEVKMDQLVIYSERAYSGYRIAVDMSMDNAQRTCLRLAFVRWNRSLLNIRRHMEMPNDNSQEAFTQIIGASTSVVDAT
jgi:hypothetical protein